MTIEEIIKNEKELAEQLATEAGRMRDKGMTAIADWKRGQSEYHLQVAGYLQKVPTSAE